MERLPSLFKSRKFFALLGLICILGIRHELVFNNEFTFMTVILFMAACSALYSIYVLTKYKKQN